MGSAALSLAVCVTVLGITACNAPQATPEPSSSAAGAVTAPTSSRPEWIPIHGETDPGAAVVAQVTRSKLQGKKVLIYIGAKWCEPCQRFHKAAQSGELDKELADVNFVEIDLDEDRTMITTLGCESKLIPFFAVPNEHGNCSKFRIEGGVKGDGAVNQILPRLRGIIDGAATAR